METKLSRGFDSFVPQARLFPWRAITRGLETVIDDTATAQVTTRFPQALEHIITHPSSRQWAGSAGNHLYLIALEGVDRGEPPGLS